MENNNSQLSDKISRQLNHSFDIWRLWGSIVANWYWFVLSLTLFLTGGYLYLRYTTPEYSIKSSLLVQESNTLSSEVLNKGINAESASKDLFNEVYILRSQDLISEVVDSLNLNVHYWVKGRVKETEIYETSPIRIVFDSAGNKEGFYEFAIHQVVEGQFEITEGKKKFRLPSESWYNSDFGRFKISYVNGPDVNKGYLSASAATKVKIEPVSVTTGHMLSSFKVTPSDGRTSLIDLYYVDDLPRRGTAFMDKLITIYQKNELKNTYEVARQRRNFITQRQAELGQELAAKDVQEEQIQVSHQLLDPASAAATALMGNDQSKQQIEQFQNLRQAAVNLRENLSNRPSDDYSPIVGAGITDPQLAGLIGQYNVAAQNLDQMSRRFGKDHPTLTNAESALLQQRKRVVDGANQVVSNIDFNIQNASRTQAQYMNRFSSAPSVTKSMKDVKRGYDVLQTMYLTLFQKGLENDISQYGITNKSKIVVAPFDSGAPISPIHNNIYSIVFLFGLAIPTVLMVLKEVTNNKVNNEKDIKNLTTLPMIGSISKHSGAKEIVVNEGIRTGIAEQFRLVRTNLDFMTVSDNKKVILITSSSPGEGKSFIALNLGMTLALGGKRVVVMEFDLRKPKLSERLNLSREGGISGYLAGQCGLDKAIKASGVHPNLYIANCGPVPPNPAELLVIPRTRQLIEDLQEMFDIIIIDTAPIGLVSDALVLSQYAGVNIFVARQAVTVQEQLKILETTVQEGKIRNMSILFNGVEHQRRYGYGYGGYGYGYGYGYGNGYGYGSGNGYYITDGDEKKKKGGGLKAFFTGKK